MMNYRGAYTPSAQRQVAPEEAAMKLRERINSRGDWDAVVGAILICILSPFFVLLVVSRHIFTAVFMLVILLFLARAVAPRIFRPKHGESRVLLGKSFRHLVSAGRGTSNAGSDGDYYLDYLGQPNPHALIVGSTSAGKTTTMRAFISRISAKHAIPFLLIDWNGENEEWAGEVNASLWRVPQHFKVNLFKLNGLSKEERAGIATDGLLIAARLTTLQSIKVKSALLKFYLNGKEPTLFELWKAMCWNNAKKNSLLDQKLRGLQRVIGTEPQEFWAHVFDRCNVVSLRGLNDSEKALVTYTILRRIVELFDKEPWKDTKPKAMIVIDESWQLFRKEGFFEEHREHIAERIVRMGRKYGIGLIVSTQQLDDIPNVFINSCSLLMLHQQRELSHRNSDMLQLDGYERTYLRNAAQGEILLFDRGRAQNGFPYPEYIKIAPFIEKEMGTQPGAIFQPKLIEEPEMPIEEAYADQSSQKVEKPVTQTESLGQSTVEAIPAQKSTHKFTIPQGAPSPSEHAAMLGIYHNKGKGSSEVISYIKQRGWLTSPSTLYGSKGSKPGILDNVVRAGFARKKVIGMGLGEDKFELTEEGLKWVDPERILVNQSDKLGSEEHKRLLIKTIEKLHESNTLVLTTNEKHSFDLFGCPINPNKKWIWDQKAVKGYEVQTSARTDSIEMNKGKTEMWGIPLVWVADNDEVIDSIKKLTENDDEYLFVS